MNHCPFCGTPPSPPAQFCQHCGRAQPVLDPETAERIDHATLDRLRGERARLSRELTSLRAIEVDRQLTSAERRSWDHLLSAWKDITAELTAMLDAVAPRQEDDRRSGERRQPRERRGDDDSPAGQERRSGLQRRMRHRRKGGDRRKPFADEES